jgi:hypothetical protein
MPEDNPCIGCQRNCCVDFVITKEISNHTAYTQTLEKYPFIHRTGSRSVFIGHDRKRVGIHNCDRFNPDTGNCEDHDTIPRPPFCTNTGVVAAPQSGCLLKKTGL